MFTTFHVVSSEKKSVKLFYKVRNGWNRSGLALGYSLAKLFLSRLENYRCKIETCYFTKPYMIN